MVRGVLPVWDSEDEQDLIRAVGRILTGCVFGGSWVTAVQGWWCGGRCRHQLRRRVLLGSGYGSVQNLSGSKCQDEKEGLDFAGNEELTGAMGA